MKQRCGFRGEGWEGKDKDKRARHRNENPAFVAFDDIMTDIAKNISAHCTTQPSNEPSNAEPSREKATPIDPIQYALSSETFAKAGEVLSNLAHHFVNVMDPFAMHANQTSGNSSQASGSANQMNGNSNPNEATKTNEEQNVADENQNGGSNVQSEASVSNSASNEPIVPTTDSAKEQVVTIEDVMDCEPSSPPRETTPTHDWAVVDSFGRVEETDQTKQTGAIPKVPVVQSPASSVGSVVDGAAALPNYAVLARDLENHLHHTLKSQASQTPPQMPIIHHPSKL